MAQFNPDSLLKDLEEMNQCPICLEPLNQPKFLPCGHSFCFTCLESHYTTSCSPGTIVCSLDRSRHPLPEEGINGLPGDHRSNQLSETLHKHRQKKVTTTLPKCSVCKSTTPLAYYCIQCCTAFCRICFKKHEQACTGHLVLVINQENISDLRCNDHENHFKVEFCSDCSCLACRFCLVNDHVTHQISQLSYTFGWESEVSSLNDKVCSFENDVNARCNEIKDCAANTDDSEKQLKQDINQHIDKLIASLEARRMILLSGADEYFNQYRTKHTRQQVTLDRAKNQAQSIKAELTSKAQVVPMNPNIVPESLDISDLKQQVEALSLPEVVIPPIQCTFKPYDSLDAGKLSMKAQKLMAPTATPHAKETSPYQLSSTAGCKEENKLLQPHATPKQYGPGEKECSKCHGDMIRGATFGICRWKCQNKMCKHSHWG